MDIVDHGRPCGGHAGEAGPSRGYGEAERRSRLVKSIVVALIPLLTAA